MIKFWRTRSGPFVVDRSDVPAIHALAAAEGVTAELLPSRGVEPTASLVLVGKAAAVAAVRHVLDQRRGGQVIDLAPDAPERFYRTTKVHYGMVIIIAVDGKVTVDIPQPDGVFGEVVSTLPQLLPAGGDAQQVVEVVAETFGDDVRIETETASMQ